VRELARARNWALGAGVLALIVSVVRLEPWRTPSTPVHRAHTAEQKSAMEPDTVVIDAVVPKPSPVQAAAASKTSASKTVLVHHVTIRRTAETATLDPSSQSAQRRETPDSDLVPQDVLPPAIAASPTSSSPRLDWSSGSGILPEREISWQRISGGTLLRKVQPTYPQQALTSRLEGSVTILGAVAESGRLEDLKIVSGDPILARAALEAVQQWVYQPYMLNGKPITQATEITVNFKLPQ